MMKFKTVSSYPICDAFVDLTVEVNGEKQLHRIFLQADDDFTLGAVWALGKNNHDEELWDELSRFFEGRGTIENKMCDIIINRRALLGE